MLGGVSVSQEIRIDRIDGRVLSPPVVFPASAQVVEVEVYFTANGKLECFITYYAQVDMSWPQVVEFYQKRYAKHIVKRMPVKHKGVRGHFLAVAEASAGAQREILILMRERPIKGDPTIGKSLKPNLPDISITVEAPNFAQQVATIARDLREYAPTLDIPCR